MSYSANSDNTSLGYANFTGSGSPSAAGAGMESYGDGGSQHAVESSEGGTNNMIAEKAATGGCVGGQTGGKKKRCKKQMGGMSDMQDMPRGMMQDMPGGMMQDVPGGMPTRMMPGGMMPDMPGGMMPDIPGGMMPDMPGGMNGMQGMNGGKRRGKKSFRSRIGQEPHELPKKRNRGSKKSKRRMGSKKSKSKTKRSKWFLF